MPPPPEAPALPGSATSPPSPFLTAQTAALDAAAALGPVADLACGRGRNALAVAARGHRVVGIDRSREHLEALVRSARSRGVAVQGGAGRP